MNRLLFDTIKTTRVGDLGGGTVFKLISGNCAYMMMEDRRIYSLASGVWQLFDEEKTVIPLRKLTIESA